MDIKFTPFHERLSSACSAKKSYLCVGIDPRPEYLPSPWSADVNDTRSLAEGYLGFSRDVIDAVADHVPIIKPQSAFFEALGYEGIKVLEEVVQYAHSKNLLVLGDIKRGDIGTTASAYAKAAFRLQEGRPLFDAVTVNPYLGSDGVMPFIEEAKKTGSGVFVLCKTSNPSSTEIQDLGTTAGTTVFNHVAELITEWGASTPGVVGAVVGATHPQELASLRKQLPWAWILIPGIGAQGGHIDDVLTGFDNNQFKALISASRSITFPWLPNQEAPKTWKEDIRHAALSINSEIQDRLF